MKGLGKHGTYGRGGVLDEKNLESPPLVKEKSA